MPGQSGGFYPIKSAGEALVGLLFVAISIAPERTVMGSAPVERQVVSASAFVALVNAFFISIAALLPGANLGWVTLAMSVISLFDSLSHGWTLLRSASAWQRLLRRVFMIALSLTLYSFELYYAIVLLLSPSQTSSVFALSTILLGIYGVGLLRAWELLGARRYGLLGWLNPLHDTERGETATSSDRSDGQKKTSKEVEVPIRK